MGHIKSIKKWSIFELPTQASISTLVLTNLIREISKRN